jgi:hypothetical protein
MTNEEVEIVAELLAKVGGNWFPERARLGGKMVTSRQRDLARLILAEVERTRMRKSKSPESASSTPEVSEESGAPSIEQSSWTVGATVEYCPPGDKRSFTCRIEKLENGRAYLAPVGREVGWVSTHTLLPLKS